MTYFFKSTSRSLLLIVIALCALTGCEVLFGDPICEPGQTYALEIEPPSSARDFEARCSTLSYRARFTISPDDLETVMHTSRIAAWETNPTDFGMYDDEAAAMQSSLYGEYMDGAYLTQLLVDTSDPQRYRVFYYSQFID
jgi:hypothetical protein